jgi:hypothetical protein
MPLVRSTPRRYSRKFKFKGVIWPTKDDLLHVFGGEAEFHIPALLLQRSQDHCWNVGILLDLVWEEGDETIDAAKEHLTVGAPHSCVEIGDWQSPVHAMIGKCLALGIEPG